jgi:hypothetical protein
MSGAVMMWWQMEKSRPLLEVKPWSSNLWHVIVLKDVWFVPCGRTHYFQLYTCHFSDDGVQVSLGQVTASRYTNGPHKPVSKM